MPRFLILRLDGPMQAWGTHTFEDFRPSNLYPTRSGLLGLLSRHLPIPVEHWQSALRANLAERLHEANLQAFEFGRSA